MDEGTKRAAMALLRRGEATPAEAAELAGVSRMTAWRWAREVDWEAARLAHLSRLWARQITGAKMKPSKARLRQIADEAKVVWDGTRTPRSRPSQDR